jgi:alkylation response protein AidB-like acyl-CoA dehydrogenase
LAALREGGFLKLWRPVGLGGVELSPVGHAIVAEEIACSDAAAAWVMMAASNAAFDLRMARPSFVEEVYRDPDALVCTTFNKPLTARETRGGYEVTGQVPFASGCQHAQWLGHLAIVEREGQPMEEPGSPRVVLVYHPRERVQIVDDWDSLGLRGTSSNTICAARLFVPEERSVDLARVPAPSAHFSGALYRCPIALLSSTIAAPALGVLRAALQAATQLAKIKQPFGATKPLAQRAIAQVHYARALARYRASRAYLHAELERAFQSARELRPFSLHDKAALILAASHTAEACVHGVRDLATLSGTSGVYKHSALEHAVRDIETLRHHALLAEARYMNVAQVAWDLEMDFPLLAMN